MQFWPPDDEHMCSKHVEAWNKTYFETILSIKLVKYWDKYTKMHGQQNVKRSKLRDKFILGFFNDTKQTGGPHVYKSIVVYGAEPPWALQDLLKWFHKNTHFNPKSVSA